MTKERSNSDSQLIIQGSILAGASIISRIIGLVYRIPLTAIIGKTGNDYYGTAYEIYNILLIISSYSIPLAVSKLVAARAAKAEPAYIDIGEYEKAEQLCECMPAEVKEPLMIEINKARSGGGENVDSH